MLWCQPDQKLVNNTDLIFFWEAHQSTTYEKNNKIMIS